MRNLLLVLLVLAIATPVAAQQKADSGADLSVAKPAYASGTGARLAIDGGHRNFHKVDGRYAPFAQLMRNDGLRVSGRDGPFTAESLAQIDILVVANALHPSNDDGDNWKLPTPSAFTPDEVAALKRWVEAGGSLLLIADHMPFAGAAEQLGAAFGVRFENVYAVRGDGDSPDIFTLADGSLANSPVLAGRDASERVDRVRTFTGSSFTADSQGAFPVLKLGKDWTLYATVDAGEFLKDTPKTSGEGRLQGALLEVGRGRVAVFAEAAMFSAQTAGDTKMGLHAPGAEQNKQFALNIVRWLARSPGAG